MLPKVLTDFNCFIDGVGYAGKASALTQPTITKKMQEVFTAGMAAPAKVPVGYEAIEAELTFLDPATDLVKLIKKNSTNAINARFVGTYFEPGGSGSTIDCEIVLTGTIEEYAPGELKRGEQPETKFKLAATYYKCTVGEEVLHEINALEAFDATA